MPVTSVCPDEHVWQSILEGRLRKGDAESLPPHLSSCPACAARLEGLARITPPPAAELVARLKGLIHPSPGPVSQPTRVFGELPPGRKVGRYRLGEPIGLGGMGTVFLGYDPELNRPVAIKLPQLKGT